MDDFSKLIKASLASGAIDEPVSPDFERRVMAKIAQQAILRARRRTRFGFAASLVSVTVAAAACVVAVVVWIPANIIFTVDLGAVVDNLVAGLKALLP